MTDYDTNDDILDVDPEAAMEAIAPEGTYTASAHGATLQGVEKRSFEARGRTVSYLDFAVSFQNDGQLIWAHTEPFGEFNTRLDKGQRSKAEEFLKACDLYRKPASEAVGLPVVVSIGLREYVRKADQLSEEERAAGEEPRMSRRNFIKGIALER